MGNAVKLPEGFVLEEEATLPEGFVFEDTAPEFDEQTITDTLASNVAPDYEDRIRNSLYYTRALQLNPEAAFDLEPQLNEELFGTKTLSDNPAVLFKDAFVQSLADKPAMMLKGVEVYTPGRAFGVDSLLDKSATFLQELNDPKKKQQLQEVASGKLWPTGEGRRWWQVEAKYLPEVINTWAVNVADQIPIILTTLAGRKAGKIVGKPIGSLAGAGAALLTGGPDPSDVVTAPAVVAITSEVIKHLGGAAPLVAMEAGNFMDEAGRLGIDRDIAEKYAKGYGLGSGAIEYAQNLWVLGRYSKISKVARDGILKQVLSHIGGSLFGGVEEISQQGLQNFLMQKAVAEMKKRHPDFEGVAPTITEGMKRSGIIAAGVQAITGLPGTGMSIADGALARRRQVKPETKKLLGEPSVAEIERAEAQEAAKKVEKAPTAAVEPSKAVEPTITPEARRVELEANIVDIDTRLAKGPPGAVIADLNRKRVEALAELEALPVPGAEIKGPAKKVFEDIEAEQLAKRQTPEELDRLREEGAIPVRIEEVRKRTQKSNIPIGKIITGKQYKTTLFRGVSGRTPVDVGIRGKGTYFTAIKAEAERYGDVNSFEVNLENPFVTLGGEDIDLLMNDLIQEKFFQGKNISLLEELASQDVTNIMKEKGYDGIIILDRKTGFAGEVIVFDTDKSIEAQPPKAEIEALTKARISAIAALIPEKIVPFSAKEKANVTGAAFLLDDGSIVKGAATHIELVNEVPTGREVVDAGFVDKEGNYLKREDVITGTQPPASAAKPKEPTTLGKDVTGILGGVPLEPAGLTKAEIEHLGKREQTALRAAQKRGLKVGFKQGVAETILDARRTLGALITKHKINEKNKMDLASIVLTYVPKEHQGRFIRRVLDLKTPKAARKLTATIREAIEKIVERQNVRDAKSAMKKQIKRIPKFGRKIKLRQGAIDNIESALEDIDVTTLSKAKRAELEAVRDDLKEVGFQIEQQFKVPSEEELSGIEAVVGERVVKQLQRLQKESIATMSADEINSIADAIRYALDQNSKETQERDKAKQKKVGTQIKESKSEMVQSREAHEINTETPGVKISIPRRIYNFFRKDSYHRWALTESATSEGVNTTTKVLDLDIHSGKVKSFDTQFAALELLWTELDRVNWNLADIERREEIHKVVLGGKKYDLTTDEIMGLGMNVRSERNAKQIPRAESLWIADREVNTPTIGEIVDAMDVLTDKELAMMDLVPTVNIDVLMPAINETSEEMLGLPLATDPFYWGLKRRMTKTVRGRTTVAHPAIEDLGVFQPFTGSKIQLRILPFWDQLLTQIQNASSFHGMAIPMENARSMLNDKSWQKAMDAAGRKREKENLIKIYERTQGIASDNDVVDIVGSTALRHGAKSILGWRVSTMAVQSASIPMAFTIIPDKYAVPLPGLSVQTGAAQSKRIDEFSSILRMRHIGGRTSIVTGDAAAQHGVEHLIFRRPTDQSLQGMRRTDRLAIEQIDIFVQRWIADTTKLEIGSKKYWRVVARRTEEVVRKTQPMWDVDERSVLASNPSIIYRSFFIFRSAREAVLNQNLIAVDRLVKNKNKAEAIKHLANTLGATTVSTAMVVGIRTAMWTAMGAVFATVTGHERPDKDEDKKKGFLGDMLENTVEYLPGGRVIVGLAKIAMRKRVWDEVDPDAILLGSPRAAARAVAHASRAYEAYFEDGDMEKLKLELLAMVTDLADAIGRAKGYPTGGILQLTTQPLERALKQPEPAKKGITIVPRSNQ